MNRLFDSLIFDLKISLFDIIKIRTEKLKCFLQLYEFYLFLNY
jgi:hypothetical protein